MWRGSASWALCPRTPNFARCPEAPAHPLIARTTRKPPWPRANNGDYLPATARRCNGSPVGVGVVSIYCIGFSAAYLISCYLLIAHGPCRVTWPVSRPLRSGYVTAVRRTGSGQSPPFGRSPVLPDLARNSRASKQWHLHSCLLGTASCLWSGAGGDRDLRRWGKREIIPMTLHCPHQTELSCVWKVEVVVLCNQSLVVLVVSVDVK